MCVTAPLVGNEGNDTLALYWGDSPLLMRSGTPFTVGNDSPPFWRVILVGCDTPAFDGTLMAAFGCACLTLEGGTSYNVRTGGRDSLFHYVFIWSCLVMADAC